MPELPEVETVKKDLALKIIGCSIQKVKINLPKIIKQPQKSEEFRRRLEGTCVQAIHRRGKYILMILDTSDYLVIHLGMSGRFLLIGTQDSLSEMDKKHSHIQFNLNLNRILIYHDVRQFGKIWLLKKDERIPQIQDLGLEPLDHQFSFNHFYKLLKKNRSQIKSLLMNQKKIVGIGNIYANEILFSAGIYPTRQSDLLTLNEAQQLYNKMREILSKAVRMKGTTMRDDSYRDLLGNRGNYSHFLQIYGKKDGDCPRCSQPIVLIRLNNRSTFVCPNCQK